MICQDVVISTGGPCPANALRRPDPDGQRRCPQHSLAPAMKEAIQLSRQRAGLTTSGTRPAVVTFERFTTAEELDTLFDEGLSVLRSSSGPARPTSPASPERLPSSRTPRSG